MSYPSIFARSPVASQVSPPRARRPRLLAHHRELKRKLATVQKDYADLHNAVFEAAQVHRRLCAPRLVRHGDVEIASEIFAVRYLPGDFFTIEETSDGVIIALGDVCGKGLAAGMWTPCLVGLVRAHAAASSEPQAIVTGVNREFCRMLAPLTSLFLARLDPATGRLDYCRAGHPSALLLRADDRLESLSEGGMLLGMAPDASFTTGCVELRAGDVLLALLRWCPRVAQQRRSGVRIGAPRSAAAPRTIRLRRGCAVFGAGRGSGFRCSPRPDRRHLTRRRTLPERRRAICFCVEASRGEGLNGRPTLRKARDSMQ